VVSRISGQFDRSSFKNSDVAGVVQKKNKQTKGRKGMANAAQVAGRRSTASGA